MTKFKTPPLDKELLWPIIGLIVVSISVGVAAYFYMPEGKSRTEIQAEKINDALGIYSKLSDTIKTIEATVVEKHYEARSFMTPQRYIVLLKTIPESEAFNSYDPQLYVNVKTNDTVIVSYYDLVNSQMKKASKEVIDVNLKKGKNE